MQSGDKFLARLLDSLLPNRAAPALAKVLKLYEGPGKTKYSVDVQILKPGTLEDTDQIIQEVPISPIWATQKKRGVYALPSVGQVMIVEFIAWNPAYPYISGVWSDEYEADEFAKDQFVITDGEGMKIIVDAKEKKITIDNGMGSQAVLEEDKVTVNNKEVTVTLNGSKASIKNGSKSLFTVLDTWLQHLIAMKTVGSPAQHVVSPDDIAKFQTDKTDLGILMEA